MAYFHELYLNIKVAFPGYCRPPVVLESFEGRSKFLKLGRASMRAQEVTLLVLVALNYVVKKRFLVTLRSEGVVSSRSPTIIVALLTFISVYISVLGSLSLTHIA